MNLNDMFAAVQHQRAKNVLSLRRFCQGVSIKLYNNVEESYTRSFCTTTSAAAAAAAAVIAGMTMMGTNTTAHNLGIAAIVGDSNAQNFLLHALEVCVAETVAGAIH